MGVLIALAAAFAVAAVVLGFFTLRTGNRAKARAIWGVYLLQFLTMAVILVPAYLGGIVFTVVTAVLGGICLLELLRTQAEPVAPVMQGTAVAFGALAFALAHLADFPMLYLAVPLATAVLLVISLGSRSGHRSFQGVTAGVLGLVYIPVFLSHLVLLRRMQDGFLLVFFMFGVSEVHDSFAYLFGKMLGGKRIFPNISPNKTWAGSVSGVVAAAAAALAAGLAVARFSLAFTAALSVVVIGFTIVGDLVSSRIKRALGVKDFGTLVPRSGGVLDVYDSLIFMAPFVYYLLLLAGR